MIVPGYDARDRSTTTEQPVPPGEIGNLWISGDSTCAGYWNQHEKTKSTIEGHWIRTGDKYTQDADGFFWYAGRSDDMLKVGGLWVSPVEVENALVEHRRCRSAASSAARITTGWSSRWRSSSCARGVQRSPELATSCSSSCASVWPSTSGRAGSSSSPSCRRPRPARSSASGCRALAVKEGGPAALNAGRASTIARPDSSKVDMRDFRYAVRLLLKSPAFTLIAIPTLRSASARTRRSTPLWTACCCGRFRTRSPNGWR